MMQDERDKELLEAVYARVHPLDAALQKAKHEHAEAIKVVQAKQREVERCLHARRMWTPLVEAAEALLDPVPCNSVFHDPKEPEPRKAYVCTTERRGHFGEHHQYDKRWTDAQATPQSGDGRRTP